MPESPVPPPSPRAAARSSSPRPAVARLHAATGERGGARRPDAPDPDAHGPDTREPDTREPDAPELQGRHAVITGGGRGIGAAIAAELASAGARVSLLGRSLEPLTAQATALGSERAAAVRCDVTDAASVAAAFAAVRERFGPVALLVNNAGAAESGAFLRSDDARFERMLEVNLMGAVRCSRAALPDMLDLGWGRVVNVASTAGLKGYRLVSAYCAAKHAVVGLTRALALEYAGSGVTVNAVCPGYTRTELLERALDTITAKTGVSEAEAERRLKESNPQGRLTEPEEVAAAVRWLCARSSHGVTGQSLAVAGGEVM